MGERYSTHLTAPKGGGVLVAIITRYAWGPRLLLLLTVLRKAATMIVRARSD